VRWVFIVCLAGCDLVWLEKSGLEDCPDTYERLEGQNRYRFATDDNGTWANAAARCVGDSPMAITHLVVIDSPREAELIRMRLAGIRTVWVGYARDFDADPQAFFAVTGEALSPTSALWKPNEPNIDGMEYAVELLVDQGLNDIEPGNSFPFVCECDAKPATRMFRFTP
jgi:hypothetical protein